MEPQTTDTHLPTTPRSFPTTPSNTRTPSRSKATWVNTNTHTHTPCTKLHFIVFVQMHILQEILICKHFLRVWNLALALWTYRAISVMSFRGQVAQNVPLLNSKSAETFFSPHSPLTHVIMLNISKQLSGRFGVHCAAVNSAWGLCTCGNARCLSECLELPWDAFTIRGPDEPKQRFLICTLKRRARGLRALWLQRKSACCFHNC